jgi:type 1 glutamine amidotransferase
MRTLLSGLLALLLLGFTTTANADNPKSAKKKRLLVITQSKGFVHDVVRRPKGAGSEVIPPSEPAKMALVEKVLTELGQKSGVFDAVCSQDARKEITAENLKNFDAVFFYTTGELPLSDTQKADLLQFVRRGGGFAGTHSATDTFYHWPQYGELIGGYFDGHPWHQKVHVIVEDTKNPATKGLGKDFTITDEIYQFKTPYSRDKLHVLLRLDMHSVKNPGKRADHDNALAWTHTYGKGRIFYTALGHRQEVWLDPRYQQHVLGGLRYVLGLASGDATPSALEGKTGGGR